MNAMMMATLASAAVLAACTSQAPRDNAGQLVARGEYLVNAIGGCNDCHTPMTQTGPDMTQSLHGATLIFAPLIEMPFAGYAPPLAGGPANYTDAEFAHFLQTGERPSGVPVLPPMPQFRLNAEDAEAVVAYIKTLAPAE